MKVGELAAALGCEVRGQTELVVAGITHDSARVEPGFVFAALPGLRHHGIEFLPEARQRGACAVLSDRDPGSDLPWILTSNPRRSTALAAWLLAGNPHERLLLVGVTGTNGKSTVCDLTARILEAAGHPVGVFSTLGYRLPHRTPPAARTTPEPCDLAPLLAQLAQHPNAVAVMEVSSHALALERVTGLTFDVACWTNFTQDHLDFHQTMEAYFAAKSRIFDLLRESPAGRRVLNLDDPALVGLAAQHRPGDITFGLHREAMVRGQQVRYTLEGSELTLVTPYGEGRLLFPLIGGHNVKNALAAALAALAFGVDLEAIREGLARFPGVGRRFQKVGEVRGAWVVD
ncbi:MAG: Mur ligase family protein, partial [Thermoanaerobaculum sp.]|nr:Mur ligase family protein [Thermoanaerobaculum sp.]